MTALLVAEVGSMPGIIHTTIPDDIGMLCMKPITTRDIVLFGSVLYDVPEQRLELRDAPPLFLPASQ